MNKVHITAVCGAGAGSSAILMITARKALASLGIQGLVEACPPYLVGSKNPDFVICAETFKKTIEGMLHGKPIPIISVMNFADPRELADKLKEPLTKLGFLK
jgi:galactitol-specific phosphotransferase system IIB component